MTVLHCIGRIAVTRTPLGCVGVCVSFNAIQDNAIQKNVIQNNSIQDNAIQDNAIPNNAILNNAMQSNAMQNHAIQNNAIQINTLQKNAIQKNAIQNNALQHRSYMRSSGPATSRDGGVAIEDDYLTFRVTGPLIVSTPHRSDHTTVCTLHHTTPHPCPACALFWSRDGARWWRGYRKQLFNASSDGHLHHSLLPAPTHSTLFSP